MARRQAQSKDTSARQAKLAALRAQEARKRRQMQVTMGAIGVVLVVIVAFIVARAFMTSNGSTGATGPASKVVNAVSGIEPSVFDKVGVGSANNPPQAVSGNHSLSAGGKPEVLYVGAEYCPYCAAQRWAVVAALSRFGTFSNLGTTTSSSTDVYPSTPTLTFHGADYSSQYLSFKGYETQTRNQTPLDQLPSDVEKVFRTFDAPPYQPAPGGSIPFLDLGGKYLVVGSSYDPGVLQGNSHMQIAQAMNDPSTDIAKGADGAANLITASLCRLTNQQPAKVCTSSGVTAAAKALGGS